MCRVFAAAALGGTMLLAACTSAVLSPVPIMPASLGPVDAEHNRTRDFARAFCSTLTHLKDPNGRSWGDCAKYVAAGGAPQPERAIAATYRYLVVGDLGGDCLRWVRAFSTSIAHLREAHQVAIEAFTVPPFGPSSENGVVIARYIDEGVAADPRRPFVLIGYGKGAADLLEAIRTLSEPKTKVAALVTIAGAVGGTWVPDAFRALMQPPEPWMGGDCPADTQAGSLSLKRDVRQRFLREHPPEVPGYSLVAEADLENTSSALRPTWRQLSTYTAEQDGVLTSWESVLPGARYLGAVRADHWAVALPFDESGETIKGIDRNRFPRDALLESVVRYVTADLASSDTSR